MSINARLVVGTPDEATQPRFIKPAVAEFISTLIFVFAGQGSGVAFAKLTNGAANTPAGLIVASIAYAFALFAAVSISANISGGHVNPAVSHGVYMGGQISPIKNVLYSIAQYLGSIVACLLLKFTTGGMDLPVFAVASGYSVWRAFVLEMVMTFGLVCTVYATALNPKKGELGIIAPLAIGLIVGANILAGGPFSGAAMNPALALGPALVSWKWRHFWVYFFGPHFGGAIAGLVCRFLFINQTTPRQLPSVIDS